ncbi:uncharacterized protein LOC108997208 isoform X1 [Juglans regia]|uniref:Uncharacterized protein LOC108997208 isoform X1 n=1 Tax=Juglans regia TaxID=51240 RepID=A0A6P9DXX6_JUGRE|nr:uncharacterized protein LOC108997208 isoform X1 [Juglans regia]
MMARSGMAFPAGLRALMMVLLLLVILLPHAFSRKQDTRDNNCPPSSCGNILNISNPFRLTSDPSNCGDQRYELSCDENNQTMLTLFGGKYYVRQINYNNHMIRVVDSGVQEDNYSFIPLYSLNHGNFSRWGCKTYSTYEASWWNTSTRQYKFKDLSINVMVIVNCEKPVMNSSYLDLETTPSCSNNLNNNDGSASSSNSSLSSQYCKRYLYAVVGGASVMDFEDSCRIEQMSLSSWAELGNHVDQNISYTDLASTIYSCMVLSFHGTGFIVETAQVLCATWMT